MGHEGVALHAEERERLGRQARLVAFDEQAGPVRRLVVAVGQRGGHVLQAVALLLVGVERDEGLEHVGPDQEIVAGLDGDGPRVANGHLLAAPRAQHREDGELDRHPPVGPLAVPSLGHVRGLEEHAFLCGRGHALRQSDVDAAGAAGLLISLELDGPAVGQGDGGHVPAGGDGEVEGEEFVLLGHEGEPAVDRQAGVLENGQEVGRDVQAGGRADDAGRQAELGLRRVVGRHRPNRGRPRPGLEHRGRQRTRQDGRVDGNQARRRQRLGLQAVLHRQADHRHVAEHVERLQPRERPRRQVGHGPDGREIQHDRLGGFVAEKDLEDAAAGLLRDGPPRQVRRPHVGHLEAVGHGKAELVDGPVQDLHRDGDVETFVRGRDLVQKDAAGHDHAVLPKEPAVQRHDEGDVAG